MQIPLRGAGAREAVQQSRLSTSLQSWTGAIGPPRQSFLWQGAWQARTRAETRGKSTAGTACCSPLRRKFSTMELMNVVLVLLAALGAVSLASTALQWLQSALKVEPPNHEAGASTEASAGAPASKVGAGSTTPTAAVHVTSPDAGGALDSFAAFSDASSDSSGVAAVSPARGKTELASHALIPDLPAWPEQHWACCGPQLPLTPEFMVLVALVVDVSSRKRTSECSASQGKHFPRTRPPAYRAAHSPAPPTAVHLQGKWIYEGSLDGTSGAWGSAGERRVQVKLSPAHFAALPVRPGELQGKPVKVVLEAASGLSSSSPPPLLGLWCWDSPASDAPQLESKRPTSPTAQPVGTVDAAPCSAAPDMKVARASSPTCDTDLASTPHSSTAAAHPTAVETSDDAIPPAVGEPIAVPPADELDAEEAASMPSEEPCHGAVHSVAGPCAGEVDAAERQASIPLQPPGDSPCLAPASPLMRSVTEPETAVSDQNKSSEGQSDDQPQPLQVSPAVVSVPSPGQDMLGMSSQKMPGSAWDEAGHTFSLGGDFLGLAGDGLTAFLAGGTPPLHPRSSPALDHTPPAYDLVGLVDDLSAHTPASHDRQPRRHSPASACGSDSPAPQPTAFDLPESTFVQRHNADPFCTSLGGGLGEAMGGFSLPDSLLLSPEAHVATAAAEAALQSPLPDESSESSVTHSQDGSAGPAAEEQAATSAEEESVPDDSSSLSAAEGIVSGVSSTSFSRHLDVNAPPFQGDLTDGIAFLGGMKQVDTSTARDRTPAEQEAATAKAAAALRAACAARRGAAKSWKPPLNTAAALLSGGAPGSVEDGYSTESGRSPLYGQSPMTDGPSGVQGGMYGFSAGFGHPPSGSSGFPGRSHTAPSAPSHSAPGQLHSAFHGSHGPGGFTGAQAAGLLLSGSSTTASSSIYEEDIVYAPPGAPMSLSHRSRGGSGGSGGSSDVSTTRISPSQWSSGSAIEDVVYVSTATTRAARAAMTSPLDDAASQSAGGSSASSWSQPLVGASKALPARSMSSSDAGAGEGLGGGDQDSATAGGASGGKVLTKKQERNKAYWKRRKALAKAAKAARREGL